MGVDKKQSKYLMGEFCASGEFSEFKSSLENFHESINGDDIYDLLNSVRLMSRANEKMLARVNSMLEYTIDRYLTESQLSEIEIDSDTAGITLSYKHYIPSFKDKSGIYTSVDTKLITVDFGNEVILTHDISENFKMAEECSNVQYMIESARVDELIKKLDQMEKNRSNSAYVINKVNKYNEAAVKNKTFEKIKCMLSRNVFATYLAAYDDIIDELRVQIEFKKQDMKDVTPYSYKEKRDELKDLQKGLLRRLIDLNFEVKYQNEADRIKLVKQPIKIGKIYNI